MLDATRGQRQFLHAVLIAGEIQQVIDQLHQTLHFFVDGVEQVGFPRLRVKARTLQKQPERHMHAGDGVRNSWEARSTNSLRTRSKARCSVTSCNTITAPRIGPWAG